MADERNNLEHGESASQGFAQAAAKGRPNLLGEFWYFLRTNKKWWLTPIILMMLLLGALVVVGGSSAAPFIYTLF